MEDKYNHNKASPPSANLSSDMYRIRGEMAVPDVQIVTSAGLRIPAHACILASSSTVLESKLERPRKHHRRSETVIPIAGVPCEAVVAFVGFLYSYRCREEEMEKYGMHLLALSHVFLVPQLKQMCSKGLIRRLTIENVVDVLQLARLCDAPDLYLKCMKLVSAHFKAAEATEGWKFLQKHDPWLELDILQFIHEAESRKTRTRKHREEQRVFLELSEGMECLEHICREGCAYVVPKDDDRAPRSRDRVPCGKFRTCQGLQMLLRHFGTCKRRAGGGRCSRCTRMWQLLRLHSFICDQPGDCCRVPLCRQFKMKAQQEKTVGHDARWGLLVKKLVSAKAISSLSAAKRKRESSHECRSSRDFQRQIGMINFV